MDNKKREEILRLLEANARYTPKDIAVMLGLGLEETENEIKQMEKEHVIIYQYPEVESLYLMSGAYDFSVILKKATMKEIANFVSTRLAVMDEVQSTATHIVLVRYKDHGTTLVEQKKDQRVMVMP